MRTGQVGRIVGENVGSVNELNGTRDLGAEFGSLGGVAALHEAGSGVGVQAEPAARGGESSRQRHGEAFVICVNCE